MFNKNRILATTACVAAVIVGTYSTATLAITVNGSAQAVVTAPLTLVENTTMDFGTVAGAGNVTITGGSAVATVTGTATSTGVVPAQFSVTAGNATPYTVAFVNGQISDGSTNINVGTFTNSASLLGTGAVEVFDVGATITLLGTETSGTYTTALGTPYQIIVNY